MGILDWFGAGGSGGASPEETRTDAVQRIAARLAALPPDRARFVAAFAYLLGRVAHADHELTEEETAAMRRLVAHESGLPESDAALVVDIAAHESLIFGGTEDFRVTREFDEISTPEQKLRLVRCLFAVSAADRAVVTKEDNEIRRIALSLKVSHGDFVAARAAVREHLAVLKRRD
jgi:uncharacterized tellurite resistance protein B-like protein